MTSERPGTVSPARTAGPAAVRRHAYLYVLLLPLAAYYIVFHYIPMYGVVIAFQDFNIFRGVFGSRWIGWENFQRLFRSTDFYSIVRNTLVLNVLSLVVGFPAPIVLALMLNEIASMKFKRTVQTLLYLPHFMSWVIMTNMIIMMLSPSTGIVNQLVRLLGVEPIYFLGKKGWWVVSYLCSGIYKGAGWGAIVFLAALTSIDPQLYEAARVDGAGRWRQTWHVTLPGILPTIVVLFLLRLGHIVSIGFEHIFLLQNSLVMDVADVISTYVYRIGLLRADYARATAVGLFQSVINCAILLSANWLSRKVTEEGIY